MPKINKVAHIVLNCRDVEASVKFYTEILGMEIVNFDTNRPAAFLSFGTQHHDVALFPFQEAADYLEPSHLGLNHIALQIDGGEDQLQEFYGRLKEHNVSIDRTSDHVLSRSVYFFDPDGNRIEVYCEMMEQAEGRQWLQENGGVAKPLAMEEVAAS